MAEEKRIHPPVRRVVTGHDSNQVAEVIADYLETLRRHRLRSA